MSYICFFFNFQIRKMMMSQSGMSEAQSSLTEWPRPELAFLGSCVKAQVVRLESVNN